MGTYEPLVKLRELGYQPTERDIASALAEVVDATRASAPAYRINDWQLRKENKLTHLWIKFEYDRWSAFLHWLRMKWRISFDLGKRSSFD